MGNLNGLGTINVELTSRCNKGDGTPGSGCWMCGRRKMEREHPELCSWGDMPIEMVYRIAQQVPPGIVVQFHNNGDPLCYPDLGWALAAFKGNIRCFNTNGKALMEKADEIIGNMETLTISVIEDDPEGEEQRETVLAFLEKKGERRPTIVYRLLGNVDPEGFWGRGLGLMCTRVLHAPQGSRDYRKPVTIPETGICQDPLTRMAIDRFGNISLCVRFDPEGDLRIGHVDQGLRAAWNSEKRKRYINWHIAQQREMLPGCNRCQYWGIPRGE